ncbi:hypothetical protein [Actinomycetospora termitidis]|uniref:Mycobacterium membrane protein n=1 Tax=Actinomycetospora termitidis TaxID=3053470 RepID=A0ABT7MBL9_9PSEU|nr:hypothetical protein [Actinomycetospora sp. Odt1-22]MDL5158056.1 hypothetical protein [Actinomycetospora sp. Odt1-22]
MGRRRWSRTAGAVAGAAMVLVGGAACSSEPPPPPARQYTVQFSVTGTAGGSAFGRYVTVGELGSNQQVNFSGVPFERTLTVPYTPEPKLQAGLVGVRPGSRISCRITVDGRTVVARTIPAPGQDVICGP